MFKLIGSVKVTVVLLIVIIAGSILGTLIPQTWRPEQYMARYGAGRYELLKILQFDKVFSSHWYSALLGLFCINLCVCSFRNFSPLIKSLQRTSSNAGRVDLQNLKFYKEYRLKASAKAAGLETVVQKAKNSLSRRFYKVKYTDAESGLYYFERGKMGRLGPLVTHASIVIILIGAILVGWRGFKGYVSIVEGETASIPGLDFQIRADKVELELYPNSNTPKDYRSKLTVIENGVPQLTKTIEVNHPLKYKGIKFYQSNFGTTSGGGHVHGIEVELSRHVPDKAEAEVIGRYKIGVGDSFEVPDSQLIIKVMAFIPDFIIDDGNVRTRSDNLNNPAARLELYENDELKNQLWIFLKHEFPHSEQHEYSLKFVGMDADPEKYYTGLQIASHPGLFVIWAGCFIMIFGMSLSFYMPFKRIWVRVSADKVEMGARSYKDRAGFQKEFDGLKAIFG